MAEVDTSSWDGAAAMSRAASSDDPAAAYAAICAGRREGDPAVQSTWALPHHANPGDPPNAAGVRNALSRLPQTEGLTNREAAQSHLDAHMEDVSEDREEESAGEPAVTLTRRTLQIAEPEITLSVSQRLLGLRLLTYGAVVDSKYGPLMFEPGAFGKVEPGRIRLRMDHADPPTGLGVKYSETAEAPYMEFRVSETERGNDQLTLAVDGVSRGVSVGFDDIAGRPVKRTIGGRAVTVYPRNSAMLAEVSTTWMPTFPEGQAGVVYVLSDEKGTGQMAETTEAPAVGAIDTAPIIEAIRSRDDRIDRVLDSMEKLTELQRAQFTVPAAGEVRKPKLKDWVEVTLRRMGGQAISPTELKALALDDVVTTEQPGLVPAAFTADYDDIINNDRPFLRSCRQIAPPATGTSMVLPIITTRAVAGTQAGSAEKGELTTTATKVGTGTFAYVSVFGGADISIQMINRAERSYFDLLTGDMGMAYALDCDDKAIAALLAGYTDSGTNGHVPTDGGVLDPEDLTLGAAWQNSIAAYKRAPDTIWLSSAAVAAFIDAKGPLTGAPLYSNLAAAFTASGGVGGVLSGLRPIYVPALDDEAVDVIVGPSRGFVWAEDPARQLQVDVPSKAGRDIALVGGLFLAPRYADAFTTYTVAS